MKMIIATLSVLLACSMASAQNDIVDWNNEDFRLTFDSPDSEISILQDYFFDDGILPSGKIVKIPVPYIWFNDSNMSVFGHVSVKRYDTILSGESLNYECRRVIEDIYGAQAVVSENIYDKNGQNVLAISHEISPGINSTTAHIGFGRCVVYLSASANYFPRIISSLTFEEKIREETHTIYAID